MSYEVKNQATIAYFTKLSIYMYMFQVTDLVMQGDELDMTCTYKEWFVERDENCLDVRCELLVQNWDKVYCVLDWLAFAEAITFTRNINHLH